ncbi:MAG: hypothetical protein JWM19_5716 [Actinomycetia bacterium]|nr:hypothetical protein [Actinomycetes bacterium]
MPNEVSMTPTENFGHVTGNPAPRYYTVTDCYRTERAAPSDRLHRAVPVPDIQPCTM